MCSDEEEQQFFDKGSNLGILELACCTSNLSKSFKPSTTTKLTILTIFFHIQVVTTSKLTIFFHPRVVTTSKLTIFFHPRVVTTSKLTIFFHPQVVTICFVQLQSYQDVELFPYFTQKKGFVSMHNSAIML